MTTTERTAKLSPMDKIAVMAGDIDQMRQRIESITVKQSIDDLLDVLDVADLGRQFGVSAACMRKKLSSAGGKVFRMGKKFVIRKVAFLEVMESLESENVC